MPKPIALGNQIFAGGFTLGVEKHFKVLAHFEDGDYGVGSFRAARPKVPVFTDANAWPYEEFPEVDFVYGNPPCAAWSPLGRRIQAGPDAWKTDPRVECARLAFTLLELMRPKVWAWESVPQAYSRGRALVDHFAERAHKLGYEVSCVLHNAQYLGAYQHRKRFFMVCHRIAVDWKPPAFDEPMLAPDALKLVPKNACPDRLPDDGYYPLGLIKETRPSEPLRGSWVRYVEKLRARAVKRGKDPDAIKLPPKAAFGERRVPIDKPSGAVIGDLMIHPTEDRYLTIGEQLFLCGYPVDYPLTGNVDARQRQIARGVLPPVAEWLARNVKRAITADRAPVIGRTREINHYKAPGTEVAL